VLNIGSEKHFKGTKRISPYIGWELGFGYKRSKQEKKENDNKRTVKGAWEEIYYSNQYPDYSYTKFVERGYWSVGANFVFGFDFYLAKDFYIGYEALWGLDYIKYSDVDITDSSNKLQNYPNYDDSSWRFGPKLINGIRIGYLF